MSLQKIFEHRKYEGSEKEVYWCNHCDTNKVDSQDKTTGEFFTFAGHAYDYQKKMYGDDYPMILLAVCAKCIAE